MRIDKWYIIMDMAVHNNNNNNAPEEEEPNIAQEENPLPVGIARIREEWRAAGLVETETTDATPEEESVIFPEVDGGADIGDYTLDPETVKNKLALSQEAIDRLVSSGELDSVLVQKADGPTRRVFSESSVTRFETDSAIDPNAVKRAAKAMADRSIVESLEEIQAQVDELQSGQAKMLQQMKDMLLMEMRNIKEQDRDLTSYVYELAEGIKDALPKKRKK